MRRRCVKLAASFIRYVANWSFRAVISQISKMRDVITMLVSFGDVWVETPSAVEFLLISCLLVFKVKHLLHSRKHQDACVLVSVPAAWVVLNGQDAGMLREPLYSRAWQRARVWHTGGYFFFSHFLPSTECKLFDKHSTTLVRSAESVEETESHDKSLIKAAKETEFYMR